MEERMRPYSLSDLQPHREAIMALATSYGIKNIRITGSLARGEAWPGDIDMLVDLPEEIKDPYDFIHFEKALSDMLQCSVDIIDIRSVRVPRIRSQMLRDAQPL